MGTVCADVECIIPLRAVRRQGNTIQHETRCNSVRRRNLGVLQRRIGVGFLTASELGRSPGDKVDVVTVRISHVGCRRDGQDYGFNDAANNELSLVRVSRLSKSKGIHTWDQVFDV